MIIENFDPINLTFQSHTFIVHHRFFFMCFHTPFKIKTSVHRWIVYHFLVSSTTSLQCWNIRCSTCIWSKFHLNISHKNSSHFPPSHPGLLSSYIAEPSYQTPFIHWLLKDSVISNFWYYAFRSGRSIMKTSHVYLEWSL